MNLKEELQNFISGDVRDDEETLAKQSRDYSIFEVRPRVVVFPKDEEDIKKLVLFADTHPEEKLSIACRSGGTDMSGGPLGESIIVDFSQYFNRIQEIGAGYAVVQPGVFYRDFEKEAEKHNLLLPSYPASKDICMVGGMVANNSGGEKSLRYGKTENYVQELRMILADGKEHIFFPLSKDELAAKMKLEGFEGDIYRRLHQLIEDNYEALQEAKPKVSKNSAGYFLWNVWDRKTFDLTKLMVGSQGTLGIITEVKLRLIRPEKHSALLVIFLKDLEPLARLVQKVVEKKPESFEFYDDETLKLALRFLPDFLHILGAKSVWSLAWQFLPEFRMLLMGGLPKLILLAEFTGDSLEQTHAKAKEAEVSVKEFGFPTHITRDAKEAEKYLSVRRKSFSLLHSHVKGLSAAPFIDDIVVLPEYLPEFLPKIGRILEPYKKKMVYTIAGHVGDGNFHIIPLMDLSRPDVRAIIPELMAKVHELVFQWKGSITGEHNDGLIRTPYLKDMYGEKIVGLFEQVKDIFDPHNIFNPGKKVRGSVEYGLKHLAA